VADDSSLSVRVYPPRGFHQASVDEKGRLKLPAVVSRYLGMLPDKKFFVTSFGVGPIRLYPDSIWQKNLQFFEEFSEDPEPVRKVAFVADALGGDTEIDGQGRVLLPPGLRRKYAVEGEPVQLHFFRGRVDIYPQAMFDEMMSNCAADLPTSIETLEKKGLR
jgi:DNA-binding transcriptional regulator/RsmH inhibitor MraZ